MQNRTVAAYAMLLLLAWQGCCLGARGRYSCFKYEYMSYNAAIEDGHLAFQSNMPLQATVNAVCSVTSRLVKARRIVVTRRGGQHPMCDLQMFLRLTTLLWIWRVLKMKESFLTVRGCMYACMLTGFNAGIIMPTGTSSSQSDGYVQIHPSWSKSWRGKSAC